jgi:hypothetical protein
MVAGTPQARPDKVLLQTAIALGGFSCKVPSRVEVRLPPKVTFPWETQHLQRQNLGGTLAAKRELEDEGRYEQHLVNAKWETMRNLV